MVRFQPKECIGRRRVVTILQNRKLILYKHAADILIRITAMAIAVLSPKITLIEQIHGKVLHK